MAHPALFPHSCAACAAWALEWISRAASLAVRAGGMICEVRLFGGVGRGGIFAEGGEMLEGRIDGLS